jgi:hypothetical protein
MPWVGKRSSRRRERGYMQPTKATPGPRDSGKPRGLDPVEGHQSGANEVEEKGLAHRKFVKRTLV